MTDNITQNANQNNLDKLKNNINNANNTNKDSDETGASDKLFSDFNDFLTLLTTQLKYQDPLSPLETAEFTNQLVGFAGVEQQLAQTEQLKLMTAHLNAQSRASAINHIGLNIEHEGDEFSLEGKDATIGYTLPKDTGRATLKIYDEKDNLVATYQLADLKPEERQNFVWDGVREAKGDKPRVFNLLADEDGKPAETKFEYSLPENTDSATLTIRDKNGTIVATRDLTVADGKNTAIWDGKGTLEKVTSNMPPGVYSYQITANPKKDGPKLVGDVKLYEIMPAGNYRAEISVHPKTEVEKVDGTVKYFSTTRVTGVSGQGEDLVLELATGKKIGIDKILRAKL
ncbi:MAG: hypothetical protein K0U45_04680 [Alphaproteobacteria bacterium]|nr:hypothetical protein [Alphaproteobacteria bacterium]